MNNLADAIGQSGGSAFLLKTLQAKEADRNSILESLAQGEGKRSYVAEVKWRLVGLNESGPRLHDRKEGQCFPMVAGVGFEPTTFGL